MWRIDLLAARGVVLQGQFKRIQVRA